MASDPSLEALLARHVSRLSRIPRRSEAWRIKVGRSLELRTATIVDLGQRSVQLCFIDRGYADHPRWFDRGDIQFVEPVLEGRA